MKILIILLRFDNGDLPYDINSISKVSSYVIPLGLSYISTILRQAGKDVSILNLNNYDGLVKDIIYNEMNKKYDVIFVGGLSMYYPHIKNIIKYIRESSPLTKVIVGGGIITAQPEIMFNLLKPDIGIIGEGEITALEVINGLENDYILNNIHGLIFKNDNELIKTTPREPIMELDKLPFPDYEPFGFSDLMDNSKSSDNGGMYDVVDYPRPYPILASRSCPYNCTFCFHPLGQKYRQRSVDNIMEEIKLNVEKYNINIITLYDELFSSDKDRMIDFCNKFKSYSDTLPYKLWFLCNNRVDSTTDEMLKIMKESGAYLLSFGLESYSQEVFNSMKKHITPKQIDNMVHLLRENKLGLMGSFIFGDVAETCDTAKETLNYIKDNQYILGANVGSFFIIPFQGTPIYKQCVREGKIPDEIQFIIDRENKWFEYLNPMNMTSLSNKEFTELKNKVFELHLTSDIYSVPLKERILPLSIDIRCPSCNEIFTMKNVSAPKGFNILKVGCRKCFFRFYLVSKWYPVRKFIIKLLGYEKVNWLNGFYKFMRRL